ncbi:ATP-binding protein [Salinimonas chungwhensis]|uniref:ATP-binding protein n=1 Tax=Salinimonas chungwhensis TaxID=265425 RepID=UPI00037E74E7|nr:ATP-binding protein [Salinimonas chungwhensis]
MLLLFYTYLFRDEKFAPWLATIVLMLEIVALNSLIALNGAASNPFSMILLVPLVLGLMVLPAVWASVIILVSLGGQISQLYLPSVHAGNTTMAAHSQNMIIGFVLTSLLITAVVTYFRYQLNQQSRALQILRERQLRDEQLLAIGTAAAQLTHDAASPIQTAQLLIEEAQEAGSVTLVNDIDEQFQRLQAMLDEWRNVADDVRLARFVPFHPAEVIRSLRHVVMLARPESQITWPQLPDVQNSQIYADRTLLPALSSILLNACEASERAGDGWVSFSLKITDDTWRLIFINKVNDADSLRLDALGKRLVTSQTGSGVGAAISNATIEKFGGLVQWSHSNDKAVTEITLPARTIAYAQQVTG